MYNSNIVRETSSEIRALARRALKGNWSKVFIGIFLFYLLMNTVPSVIDAAFSFGQQSVDLVSMLSEKTPEEIMTAYENGEFNVSTGISSLYSLALSGAFSAGLCSFLLAFFRKGDIKPGYVFNGFEYYLKTLALMLLIGLFTFLWTLLFIIPGIIAAFRYSQAFYVLADDPRKGVMECLDESKRIMTGNKMKLFIFNLSYIGWYIAAGICSGIISTVLALISAAFINSFVLVFIDLVSALPLLVAMVYVQTGCTAFYELASENLVARSSQPQPIQVDDFIEVPAEENKKAPDENNEQ